MKFNTGDHVCAHHKADGHIFGKVVMANSTHVWVNDGNDTYKFKQFECQLQSDWALENDGGYTP